MSQKKVSLARLKPLPAAKPENNRDHEYVAFDQLDGQHPWMDFVPEGYVPYQARILNEGKVAYFNFELAKEMGLLTSEHPHTLTPALKKKILDTFCLRIINEYDQQRGAQFPKDRLKAHPYMATRYLQLQHDNKQGKTSGDGRCIWNGVFKGNGRLWDVSSRGVGVTRLAPGAVEAGRPLRSGSTDFGYGCGMAELDELYGATILAEIFHRQGINTERMLALIDLGGGLGIGVRAGPNLIRPAHLFLYLRQGQRESLQRSVDYLIVRQHRNREWRFGIHHPQRYRLMLSELCRSFAQFIATLDRAYIFAWLDWDGDNVLANAGIIDYGSVRQFGVRHDQYRYDDVERFSTTLNEQIPKTRALVQTFAQIVHFLETGKRESFESFAKHPVLREFDHLVQRHLREGLLHQLGFPQRERDLLMRRYRRDVNRLYDLFTAIERTKTKLGVQKVADGVNRPAVFNMRTLVRTLIEYYHDHQASLEKAQYPPEKLFREILSEHATRKDSRLTPSLSKQLDDLQSRLLHLLKIALRRSSLSKSKLMDTLLQRATVLNREDRITGNALIHIVDEIIESRKKGFSDADLQKVMDEFIKNQSMPPEAVSPDERPFGSGRRQDLIDSLLSLVENHKEDI